MKYVIEPGGIEKRYWKDVFGYRELMYVLAIRDLSVRYKQTAIGIGWAILRPVITMLIFVAFRRMVGLKTNEVPDAVVVLAAVLPWQFFSNGLSEIAGSLVVNANLITKVYFPRIVIPFASIVVSLIDFLITLFLLLLVMAWYGVWPRWQFLMLLLFTLQLAAFSAGLGLFLAALNVKYRDFRYLLPFIVQFGLFVSPVAFTTAAVPDRWVFLYALNPLVGIIDGFRWAVLGDMFPLNLSVMLESSMLTCFSLIFGVRYFRRTERSFADVI